MLQLRRSLRNISSLQLSSSFFRRSSLRYSSNLQNNVDLKDKTNLLVTKGVRLSFLEKFVDNCGRSNLAGCTTREIYDKFIAPKAISTTYCEAALNDDASNKANVYISHCWDYKF
jgi:hypothetical protein